jgi:hypothetical protein
MTSSTSKALVTFSSLALLWLGWHYAHRYVFYRVTVLEKPIRLEKGFSFSQQFSVDIPANYEIAVQYNEPFRVTRETPQPQDEFEATCEVRVRNKVVAAGGTQKVPSWSGPWAVSGDKVTRYLGSVYAEPGEKYWVSLAIGDLTSKAVGTAPKALVVIEPKLTLFYDFRKNLALCVIAAISTVIFFLCVFAIRRRGVEK